ncbi:MAG: hypothetical protein BZ138_02940 [Methanosphaera sp. rholeuAM270]|nr:MAG: hypothetical protein BZ138_02940 [Methanosphaera sp. rholeuAM270]
MLISVMFITMSVVSAENVTDTNINMEDNGNSDIASSTEITKKATDISKTKESNTKTASKISIEAQTVKFNSTTTFKSKISDINNHAIDEGVVVYKINGKSIGNAEVNNGVASLTTKLAGLTPKTYELTAKYAENSNYLESTDNAILTILKHNSKITVDQASVVTRNDVTLRAKIVDFESGNVATSGKVAFKINGKTVGHAEVSNGIATCSYNTRKLTAKTYNVTATFGGNNLLNSDISMKSTLTVLAIPTKMTVNKVSGYSNSVVLKATVVEKSSMTYLPSGTVVFKINGKTIGNSSITDGKVSLKYNTTGLTRGNYTISAFLKPTSTYANTSANNILTIKAEDYFTFSQIKKAAVDVRTQFEANNIVDTVHIGKSRISLSEFLALMIQAIENVANSQASLKVPYKHYKTITTQTDSLERGVLDGIEILDIGDRTLNFMKNNGRPPKYVSTSLGKMGYYNIVYTFTRMLDVSTEDYMVSTCRVFNWDNIHPSNPKSRTIYITSDVVYNSKTDKEYMNKIKNKLESLGYKVKILGYGPNSHVATIIEDTLPVNAVQLSIFSGADAGVIYDVCTRSFMRCKQNRLLFFVYYSKTSTDITGLSFLKRAHDDNYMPASFTGISYPDKTLRDHGYDYVFASNVDTIVQALIDYIS